MHAGVQERVAGTRFAGLLISLPIQVLGRNLEAAITKAEELKKEWKDEFTSVEHLVLALADDARFVRDLFRREGLDATKLSEAIKQIRGSNRVTDQVSRLHLFQPPRPDQMSASDCQSQLGGNQFRDPTVV
jgi:ATP-dependent Clp protease ATP-binding subunit ClpA